MLAVQLKMLLHDVYAKNTAVNIKAVLDAKRRNGEFIGNYPPYGYKFDLDNKKKFIPDEETAPIVQMIFKWKLKGLTYVGITKRLNNMEILSPSNYLYKKGLLYNKKFAKKIYWQERFIKKTLTSQMYIGNMVQGIDRTDAIRKRQRKSESEWIIVNPELY